MKNPEKENQAFHNGSRAQAGGGAVAETTGQDTHKPPLYNGNRAAAGHTGSTCHMNASAVLLPHQQPQQTQLQPQQTQLQPQQTQLQPQQKQLLPKLNLLHLPKKQKTLPNLPSDHNPYHMESYFGFVPSSHDAALLLSAMETPGSLVKPIQRRLLAAERFAIRSGSCFVFSERESGMKRWTDGMRWSKSRVEGQFLCYKRMDIDGPVPVPVPPLSANSDASTATFDDNLFAVKRVAADADGDEMGDGEYEDAPSNSRRSSAASVTSAAAPHDEKNNILWKKCFAITIDGSVCHVVNYYTKRDVQSGLLRPPHEDPSLASIQIIPKFIDPENFRLHSRPGSAFYKDKRDLLVAALDPSAPPHPHPSSSFSFGNSLQATVKENSHHQASHLMHYYSQLKREFNQAVSQGQGGTGGGSGGADGGVSMKAETLVLPNTVHERYVTCHKRHDPQLMRINLPATFREFIAIVRLSFQMDDVQGVCKTESDVEQGGHAESKGKGKGKRGAPAAGVLTLRRLDLSVVREEGYASLENGEILHVGLEEGEVDAAIALSALNA